MSGPPSVIILRLRRQARFVQQVVRRGVILFRAAVSSFLRWRNQTMLVQHIVRPVFAHLWTGIYTRLTSRSSSTTSLAEGEIPHEPTSNLSSPGSEGFQVSSFLTLASAFVSRGRDQWRPGVKPRRPTLYTQSFAFCIWGRGFCRCISSCFCEIH